LQSLTPPPTLAADAAIDLQMHTTNSDGLWTLQQLIEYLAREQFALVAVTDHHRMDTIVEVQRVAAELQVSVLAGVEMSTLWRGKELDLLCYGFAATESSKLFMLAEEVIRRHQENAREVAARLRWQGYLFPRQQEILRAMEGEPRHASDLALLLREHGYGPSSATVWKILQSAGVRWSSTDLITVVDAAHQSSAVCVLAHPGKYQELTTPLLNKLREEIPLDGLEVYHPAHTPPQIELYRAYAQKHHLLVSAGSDSHGPHQLPIKYRAELCRSLLERVGYRLR
jgi:predicted metal-dependent phosphoesterase TrpH